MRIQLYTLSYREKTIECKHLKKKPKEDSIFSAVFYVTLFKTRDLYGCRAFFSICFSPFLWEDSFCFTPRLNVLRLKNSNAHTTIMFRFHLWVTYFVRFFAAVESVTMLLTVKLNTVYTYWKCLDDDRPAANKNKGYLVS